jgi:hypothetical protein
MTAMTTTNGQSSMQRDAVVERVIVLGDLSELSPRERSQYYLRVCESVGLNPATQPFLYVRLNGKLTLYATKNCTDQLRQIHTVSVERLARETIEGIHIVTATVVNGVGRRDEDVGAVSISGLKGESLANALMKATTKAKRRATLSLCGLSFLDESEIDSVSSAQRVTVTADGEIVEAPPKSAASPDLTQQLAASIDWDKWGSAHLERIEGAKTKGALNEAWAMVNEDKRKLNPPAVHYDALAKAKDARKQALS